MSSAKIAAVRPRVVLHHSIKPDLPSQLDLQPNAGAIGQFDDPVTTSPALRVIVLTLIDVPPAAQNLGDAPGHGWLILALFPGVGAARYVIAKTCRATAIHLT